MLGSIKKNIVSHSQVMGHHLCMYAILTFFTVSETLKNAPKSEIGNH